MWHLNLKKQPIFVSDSKQTLYSSCLIVHQKDCKKLFLSRRTATTERLTCWVDDDKICEFHHWPVFNHILLLVYSYLAWISVLVHQFRRVNNMRGKLSGHTQIQLIQNVWWASWSACVFSSSTTSKTERQGKDNNNISYAHHKCTAWWWRLFFLKFLLKYTKRMRRQLQWRRHEPDSL